MKFLELLEDNTENSIKKRGKILYEHHRIGHIVYSNTTQNNWDLEPLKIGYTLPEDYEIGIYKEAFPKITFYDEVQYDIPEGFYDENNLLLDEFGPTEWIEDIQEMFWKKYRIILVDDNFGEFLDRRHYLRNI